MYPYLPLRPKQTDHSALRDGILQAECWNEYLKKYVTTTLSFLYGLYNKYACLHDIYFLFQVCDTYLEPHHLKGKARGRPVVMLPIILYSDDTSGNKSKKWHKFDSWSVLFAGVPREINSQIPNIHFMCCSDAVSALEMAELIGRSHKPVVWAEWSYVAKKVDRTHTIRHIS